MEITHLTMAGHTAHAGAARLHAVAPLAPCPAPNTRGAAYGVTAHLQGLGSHRSTWTQGAIAKSATFMVFNRKNRPTRPLLEHSP